MLLIFKIFSPLTYASPNLAICTCRICNVAIKFCSPASQSLDSRTVTRVLRMSKQQSSRLRATPVEDMMLQKALAMYKKDYKAIVLFMQRNSEVMGEELCKFYTEAGTLGSATFKKAIERVRKRTTKLLHPQ